MSFLTHCTYVLLCRENGLYARHDYTRTRERRLDSVLGRRTMNDAKRVSRLHL